MPLYSYQCPNCQSFFELLVPLASYKEVQYCMTCGTIAKKLMDAPQIQMDIAPYSCPISGKMITSRAEHRKNLELHGCRVFEAGEVEAQARKRKSDELEFDKAIEETAGKLVHNLPDEARSRLIVEAQCNPTVEIVRQ